MEPEDTSAERHTTLAVICKFCIKCLLNLLWWLKFWAMLIYLFSVHGLFRWWTLWWDRPVYKYLHSDVLLPWWQSHEQWPLLLFTGASLIALNCSLDCCSPLFTHFQKSNIFHSAWFCAWIQFGSKDVISLLSFIFAGVWNVPPTSLVPKEYELWSHCIWKGIVLIQTRRLEHTLHWPTSYMLLLFEMGMS